MTDQETREDTLQNFSGSSVAAMITASSIFIGAICYASGASVLDVQLSHYGLLGVIQPNTYEVMRLGIVPSVYSIPVSLIFLNLAMKLKVRSIRKNRKRPKKLKLTRNIERLGFEKRKSLLIILSFLLAVQFIASGIGIGYLYGFVNIRLIAWNIGSSCNDCMVYQTPKGSIEGEPIIGNEDRVVLLTSGDNLRVVSWSEVQSVHPKAQELHSKKQVLTRVQTIQSNQNSPNP